MRRKLSHSQNFIANNSLIGYLIEKTNISPSDTVLEIGTGKGDITRQLCKNTQKVISLEKDKKLFDFAKHNLHDQKNLNLLYKDFFDYSLPKYIYKCFSNIPFNFTADIVKKLLFSINSPTAVYLFMQKEAAERFLGINKTTQISLLLKPLFSSRIIYEFKRADFIPKPSVDIVLAEFNKRSPLMFDKGEYQIFKDFITYSFSQRKNDIKNSIKNIFTNKQMYRLSKNLNFKLDGKPTDLNFKQWIKLFRFIQIHKNQVKESEFKNYSRILKSKHKNRITSHRTTV
jgi:23S rRNA (adenine-N6)-dimethyltransferase